MESDYKKRKEATRKKSLELLALHKATKDKAAKKTKVDTLRTRRFGDFFNTRESIKVKKEEVLKELIFKKNPDLYEKQEKERLKILKKNRADDIAFSKLI